MKAAPLPISFGAYKPSTIQDRWFKFCSVLGHLENDVARQFSRTEFYDLVWSKPMTHLAKDLGVSDVALHKVCKKHDIPNPPIGWWAKKAAGKPVKQTPLPIPSEGVSDRIIIAAGELRAEGDVLAIAREEARLKLSDFDILAPTEEHSLVTKSIAALRKAPVLFAGLARVSSADLIQLNIAPESIDRLQHSLNLIVAAACTLGFDLKIKNEKAAFTDGTEHVPFAIEEILDRKKHQPTEKELAKYESEKMRRMRSLGKTVWDEKDDYWVRPHWPEWDYSPSGRISFAIDTYVTSASNLRKSFRDGKTQTLESMVPDIAAGLAVILAGKREDARRAEEARLKREEAEHRHNEAQRLAYIEEKREKALGLVFERIDDLERLRRLESQLTGELESADAPRVREMLRWVTERAKVAASDASAEGLETLFHLQKVFGPDEGEGFHPSFRRW